MTIKIEFVKGDLVQLAKDQQVKAVAHGCNCFHAMGSGIAPLLNELTDGKLLEADRSTPCGDINKLGTFTFAEHNGVRFYNLYSQFVHQGHVKQTAVLVHWSSFEDAIESVIDELDCQGIDSIHIPLIGCGLAGGNVSDFRQSLENVADKIEGYVTDFSIVVVLL